MFKIIRLLFSLAVIVAVVLIIRKNNGRKKWLTIIVGVLVFCYRLGTYVGASTREIFAKILVAARGI